MISKNIDKVPALSMYDEVLLLWKPTVKKKIEGISYRIVKDEIISIYCSLGGRLSFNIVYDGDRFVFPERVRMGLRQLDLFRDESLGEKWE